ncbi:MAG: peptidase M4 family protein, partial [Cystobacter sp.]
MSMNWKRGLAGVCLFVLGAACGGPESSGALEATGESGAGLSMEVVSRGAGGVPSFLRGNFGSVTLARSGLTGVGLTSEAERALEPVLRGVAPLFRLTPKELRVRTARVDEVGNTHVRYEQVRKGMRVVGGELILNVARSGTVYAVNGS